jgi:hypothetical protein
MGRIVLEKSSDEKLYVNGERIFRYLSPNQQIGKELIGHDLRLELSKKRSVNGCVLHALIIHPELVPRTWAQTSAATYFWATIGRHGEGPLYVDGLATSETGGRPWVCWGELGKAFTETCYAAVLQDK